MGSVGTASGDITGINSYDSGPRFLQPLDIHVYLPGMHCTCNGFMLTRE